MHSPFGAPVHAPWAQAIETRVRERLGLEVQTMYTDDGIVVRLPEADEAPPADSILFEPEEIEDLVVAAVGSSALFASRFRESAARALLLPRRRPGSRTPLWQQRQKVAGLLQVASRYGPSRSSSRRSASASRTCSTFPGLQDLMGAIRRREIRVVEVDTPFPSPFASSLQFGYVAAFMYEGDAPLAERRAQALSLDRSVLAELLGREELRELIDPAALADLELEVQHLTEDRKARDADALHDLLLRLGRPVRRRGRGPVATSRRRSARGSRSSAAAHRAIPVRVAGEERWAAVEDAARLRDGLGVALPPGVPDSLLEPVDDPLGDLVGRYARTHGPFLAEEAGGPAGARLSRGRRGAPAPARANRPRRGQGEFRPGGAAREWIDAEVLRRLRRRSLAALRREVEPVPQEALARFAVAWQGLGAIGARGGPASTRCTPDDRAAAGRADPRVGARSGRSCPARLPGYEPRLLDELTASRRGRVGRRRRARPRRRLGRAGPGRAGAGCSCPSRCPASSPMRPSARPRRARRARRACSSASVAEATGSTERPSRCCSPLWELVWAGLATNDTLVGPPRLHCRRRRRRPSRPRRGRRGPPLPSRLGPPAGAGTVEPVAARGETDPTRRLHAAAEQLLRRHGIVTRGAVDRRARDRRVRRRVRRAQGHGGVRAGAAAATSSRASAARSSRSPAPSTGCEAMTEDPRDPLTLVLAASDPANPYGAALSWPERDAERAGHRPGRKAGASVVLVDGRLVVYVERGGRTLLTYTDDARDPPARGRRAGPRHPRRPARRPDGRERADGETVFDNTPLAHALAEAGFRQTTKGLRLRG